ncbi:hypothetical protein N2152v2_004275 [Parachlorella kessleri]
MQTAADQVRNTTDHDVLFLDGGDQFSGTLWDTLYRGQLAPIFQNRLGVQAYTVGNHDCDYGADTLANYTLKVDFPIVVANMNASAHPVLSQTIQSYAIITLSNGVQVGIVGFTTETTEFTSSCGDQVSFVPPIQAVPAVLAELKAQDIKHIIGLSHAGYDQDVLLAAEPAMKDLDLIVGAHTHTFLYGNKEYPNPPQLLAGSNATDTPEGPYPTLVKNGDKSIVVIQAYWASRYLGRLETEWTSEGNLLQVTGAPILLGGANSSNYVPADPATIAILNEYEGPVLEANKQVVGSSLVALEGDAYVIRRYETNLGNMLADAMTETALSFLRDVGSTPLVTIVNAGAVRSSLPAGNITYSDLANALPYSNWIVIKRLTGEQLWAALENAVSALDHPYGRFVQVHGLRYAYDGNATAGKRIIAAILPDNQSVRDVPELLVVMNNYMAQGSDGFTMLVDPPTVLDTSAPLVDSLEHYLGINSPVAPTTKGRVVVCGNMYGPATPEDPLCQDHS